MIFKRSGKGKIKHTKEILAKLTKEKEREALDILYEWMDDSEKGECFSIFMDKEPIAFALTMLIRRDSDDEDFLDETDHYNNKFYLKYIFTFQEHRRKNYGTELMVYLRRLNYRLTTMALSRESFVFLSKNGFYKRDWKIHPEIVGCKMESTENKCDLMLNRIYYDGVDIEAFPVHQGITWSNLFNCAFLMVESICIEAKYNPSYPEDYPSSSAVDRYLSLIFNPILRYDDVLSLIWCHYLINNKEDREVTLLKVDKWVKRNYNFFP